MKICYFRTFEMILPQYFHKGALFLNSSLIVQVDNFMNCISYQTLTREFYLYFNVKEVWDN